MERLVRFDLLGQEYSFYTAAPEEEVAEIVNMVTEIVEQNSSGASGNIAVSKIAVLAGLNIASQYVELRCQFEQYKRDTDKRISLLSRTIDKGLSASSENQE